MCHHIHNCISHVLLHGLTQDMPSDCLSLAKLNLVKRLVRVDFDRLETNALHVETNLLRNLLEHFFGEISLCHSVSKPYKLNDVAFRSSS